MADKSATIVADLGFGDAGKGTVIDHLARRGRVAAVVRFNGGAQARHHVVTPDGRVHGFAQFCSGTFVPGMRTHLSRFMLLDPQELLEEAVALGKLGCGSVLGRLSIDEQALVVTPYHRVANVIRETLRGIGNHGTCGLGIGETMALAIEDPRMAIHARDLRSAGTLVHKATAIQDYYYEMFGPFLGELPRQVRENYGNALCVPDFPHLWGKKTAEFAKSLSIVSGDHLKQLSREGNLLFEGAQGVLLDEWRGFHPYTTWSTTTFENAQTLLREIEYEGDVHKLGVLRSYMTRHGAGPFPTNDPELAKLLPEAHNSADGWQGEFRVGWFDTVLAQYALHVCNGADSLAITHLDRIADMANVRMSFAYQGEHTSASLLPVNPDKTNLDAQAEITKFVQGVTPIYQDVTLRDERYADLVGSMLSTPVSLTSYGPMTTDKRPRLLRGLAA
ncbi:MAG: adenylosuccinate synthetase [Candidatus Pacebacteria bacterium]|nr:adenylosuccinate synthetase [Candidatus Paceibacterota bacterium]